MTFLANARNRARTGFSAVTPTGTTLVILVGIATALIMLSHLAFLTRYPPVFIDEPWYANAAWNWLKTGINFDTMHAGVLDQFDYEWLRWPFIGNAPWLASFAILGLGLFQARLVSWVFGALLLLATVMAGRQSYGIMGGALATLLLSMSSHFLQASHYARPDVMLAAVVMAAYLVALIALQKNKWWAHILAGLLLGLSLDIHRNGALFMPGLAALYLVTYRSEVLRKSGTWLCAGGGLLGIAYYVGRYILPSPSTYFTLANFAFGSTHKLPLQTLSPWSLLASARAEIGRYHFYENNLDLALIGASIAYLAVRRSRADRLLLLFVGSAFVGFVLFAGNKHDIYAILLYPFFLLMVAETLVSLIRAGTGLEGQRVFVIGLLALLLVNSAMHYARPIANHRDYNYYSVTEQMESVIPEGARVMGTPEWWLGLADYDYRSSLNLTFYHFFNGYSLTEGLEEARPDILIMDVRWRSLLVDKGYFPSGPGFEVYKLPGQEFKNFLVQRGEKLLEFRDPWHGRFEIYAIRWY